MRIKHTGKSAGLYTSRSPELAHDVLHLITGIPSRKFLDTYAGRDVVVTHGPLSRWKAMLGSSVIPSMRALAGLIPCYSQEVRRVVYDKRGIFRYQTLTEDEVTIEQSKTCLFFYDYDGHFRMPRLLLDSLCSEFGYVRRGAQCRGSYQTPGAFIARHCDNTDVVILQMFGTRHWRIERNSEPPVGIDEPVRKAKRLRKGWSTDFGNSSRVIILRPGSALYVPRGWWHETRSSVHSFALTIGLVAQRKPRPAKDSQ